MHSRVSQYRTRSASVFDGVNTSNCEPRAPPEYNSSVALPIPRSNAIRSNCFAFDMRATTNRRRIQFYTLGVIFFRNRLTPSPTHTHSPFNRVQIRIYYYSISNAVTASVEMRNRYYVATKIYTEVGTRSFQARYTIGIYKFYVY